MSSSKSSVDDILGESWVHIGSSCGSQGGGTPGSVTPQLNPEEYIRLLREAQRESNSSSARVSPRSSPKSPPNSPVQGTPLIMEWQSYYLNTEIKDDPEIFCDWSSRPDQQPPKNWTFRTPKADVLSLRYAKVGNDSVFSRRGLCTLFLTNLLSLLLGTGVGLWLSKYGFFVPAVKVR
ncbi:BCL2/adenovirus E1B 19 kDa protein-interacting protein 3 isoform X2 [Onthophagus taurus]|uniref:BCL2/adenovirus E1B 19 kDa protein-interacting protein 3 isoform X2 n=1 Tax=Onthophagus taurus TaxID=166361 RepID=UPI000C204905|nr:BCL2/adenovirus E1B 19 kDa protein-interacting protein 3 isoform X2 [Onthophagus taurus]